MASTVFNPANFIKKRKEVEDEWRRSFREGRVEIKLEELGSQDKNPFVKVYPEHTKLLSSPHLGQQHRMQDLRVIQQYQNRGMSTLIVLPTDFKSAGKVSNYFGAPIDVVADYCVEVPHPEKMPPLIPMILDPEEYLKKPELLQLYKPLFQRLHNAGKGDLLVFANRMEDCLTYQKLGEDWTTFKKRKIRFWADKGIDKAGTYKRGDLPEKKPSQYLGERIAWLNILGLENYADDIGRIVFDEKDVMFACDVASVLQTLHISPILYSHKMTTALHDPFDTRQLFAIGIPYMQKVIKWPVDKALKHLPFVFTLATILGYVAYSRFVQGPPPEPLPYIISKTVEDTRRVLEIALNAPGLIDSYDKFNRVYRKHNEAVGARDNKGATNTADDIFRLRELIAGIHKEKFSDVKQAIRAYVRVIPAVGSLWTSDDSRLGWLTRLFEREVQGRGLVGQADRLLEALWKRGLYREAAPILTYQPDFRIYDLSRIRRGA